MKGNKGQVCQKGCNLPRYLHNSKREYTIAIHTNITHAPLTLLFFLFFLLFLLNVSPLALSPHLNAESLPLQDISWLPPPLFFFRWRQTTVCVITAANKASCLNLNVAWCRISSQTAVNSISMFNYRIADWINHELPLHIFHIEGDVVFLFWNCILWWNGSYKGRD